MKVIKSLSKRLGGFCLEVVSNGRLDDIDGRLAMADRTFSANGAVGSSKLLDDTKAQRNPPRAWAETFWQEVWTHRPNSWTRSPWRFAPSQSLCVDCGGLSRVGHAVVLYREPADELRLYEFGACRAWIVQCARNDFGETLCPQPFEVQHGHDYLSLSWEHKKLRAYLKRCGRTDEAFAALLKSIYLRLTALSATINGWNIAWTMPFSASLIPRRLRAISPTKNCLRRSPIKINSRARRR